MRLTTIFLLLSAALFAEPEFLPLKNGNSWTYRKHGGTDEFTVKVGTATAIDGNIYHRLTGYVSEPLWVRFGDSGALYYRDQDRGIDVLLTSFEPFTRGWFIAPFRICDQEGQTQDKRGESSGPAGPFTSTLVIRYRAGLCADAGFLEEQYVANVGMVERTLQSIAGPRRYELDDARLGAPEGETAQGASFTVTTERLSGVFGAVATLELKAVGNAPVRLHFSSSQEFDLRLRKDDGTVIWTWSADKLFLAVIRDELTTGKSWQEAVPLTDAAGKKLPAGRYELEGWIASGRDRTQFSAVSPVVID